LKCWTFFVALRFHHFDVCGFKALVSSLSKVNIEKTLAEKFSSIAESEKHTAYSSWFLFIALLLIGIAYLCTQSIQTSFGRQPWQK